MRELSDRIKAPVMQSNYEDAFGACLEALANSRDQADDEAMHVILSMMRTVLLALEYDAGLHRPQAAEGERWCSFCGNPESEGKLIAGREAAICRDCTVLVRGMFDEET